MGQPRVGIRAFWHLSRRFTAFALVSVTMFSLISAGPATTKSTERSLNIVNNSGVHVALYWVHPDTREGSLMSEKIPNGGSFSVNSFIGHEFELRQLPSARTGVCKSEDQTCGTSFFTVSPNYDQVININKGIEIEFLDDQIRAKNQATDIVGSCRTKAANLLQAAGTDATKIKGAMTFLTECVEDEVAGTLSNANEELAFQAKVRTGMANMMENYTCFDQDLESSEPLRTESWINSRDRIRREVQVLLDRPASKIMFVKGFISPAECDAMAEAASSTLHKATVADGKGGSQYSEHRKAMQAGIKVNWKEEANGDKIATLSRRVYDYTNYVLDLDIKENGQEDLMSIQYFGRGLNDTEPDRYTPHCDG